MRIMNNNFCILGFFLLVISNLSAQESIVSGGCNATCQNGSVSYTIGQVFFNTETNENGSVQPGVQQTYEIKVFTEYDDPKDIQLECEAYPNPASDFLLLKIKDSKPEELEFKLYNNAGMLLDADVVDKNEMRINMRPYFPATYYLKLLKQNKEIKVFKIIKK